MAFARAGGGAAPGRAAAGRAHPSRATLATLLAAACRSRRRSAWPSAWWGTGAWPRPSRGPRMTSARDARLRPPSPRAASSRRSSSSWRPRRAQRHARGAARRAPADRVRRRGRCRRRHAHRAVRSPSSSCDGAVGAAALVIAVSLLPTVRPERAGALRPCDAARLHAARGDWVVFMALGLSAPIVAPRASLGETDDARRAKALADLKGIEQALNLLPARHRRYPTTEQGLESAGASSGPPSGPRNWNSNGLSRKRADGPLGVTHTSRRRAPPEPLRAALAAAPTAPRAATRRFADVNSRS